MHALLSLFYFPPFPYLRFLVSCLSLCLFPSLSTLPTKGTDTDKTTLTTRPGLQLWVLMKEKRYGLGLLEEDLTLTSSLKGMDGWRKKSKAIKQGRFEAVSTSNAYNRRFALCFGGPARNFSGTARSNSSVILIGRCLHPFFDSLDPRPIFFPRTVHVCVCSTSRISHQLFSPSDSDHFSLSSPSPE